jgi:DNA polymerase-3 subunit gamma/tau
MLTREAFNALLKTLEEPPPHIIFIFATTEPHKIPETILSRCQRYDFKRIPLRLIVDSLRRIVEEEKISISQRGIFFIAQESEGSLRDAQSLLDQVISYGGKEIKDEDIMDVLGLIDRQIIYDTIEALIEKDPGRCVEIVEYVYQYGIDLQHFCRELLQYLRNLILIKVSQKPEALLEITEEEFEILKRQADSFQFEHLNYLFNILLKGEEEIAQSTFPRIMMEMTLIRMATTRPIVSIDEIIKRLERIEKRGVYTNSSIISDSIEKKITNQELNFLNEKETTEVKSLKEESSINIESSLSLENDEKLDYLINKEPSESKEVYKDIWKELVEYTKAKNPILGSFLSFGSLLKINDEKVELGFEKDSFHYDRILEKENKKQLESICKEYFKKDVKIIVSPLELKEKNNNRIGRKEKGLNHGGLEMEKREKMKDDALVKEIVRIFDGKVIQ